MKLLIEEGARVTETEIEIRCQSIDPRLKTLIQYIHQYSFSLKCFMEQSIFYIPSETIYYIESVDGKSFVYCKKSVYDNKDTLATLEARLLNTTFVRISKSCILNTSYLKSVSPLWNHRLEAMLFLLCSCFAFVLAHRYFLIC